MSRSRVLLLDHRDSFVFLLADQLARLGADVDVVRAGVPLTDLQCCLAERQPTLVVLSPGPGHPVECATTLAWLATRPAMPVLGVCLGHQAIGLAAGARIERGVEPTHGESCEIEWHELPFAPELPQRMTVARYHSLVVADPPPPLRLLATTRDRGRDTVMAIMHTELPQLGLQFHPESVLTPHGSGLLRGVLGWARRHANATTTNTYEEKQ